MASAHSLNGQGKLVRCLLGWVSKPWPAHHIPSGTCQKGGSWTQLFLHVAFGNIHLPSIIRLQTESQSRAILNSFCSLFYTLKSNTRTLCVFRPILNTNCWSCCWQLTRQQADKQANIYLTNWPTSLITNWLTVVSVTLAYSLNDCLNSVPQNRNRSLPWGRQGFTRGKVLKRNMLNYL
jgi:hypothetical protein